MPNPLYGKAMSRPGRGEHRHAQASTRTSITGQDGIVWVVALHCSAFHHMLIFDSSDHPKATLRATTMRCICSCLGCPSMQIESNPQMPYVQTTAPAAVASERI